MLSKLLAEKENSGRVVQVACCLAESLAWQLGQRYLQGRGSAAFLSDFRAVPYIVNNDGSMSRRAAELLFANLRATGDGGQVGKVIVCLELGIGVGLFARYFLDAFLQLCQEQDKDYYDRLTYIAADHSECMLRDAARRGVFANHPGHYVLRIVDAMDPGRALAAELRQLTGSERGLRAVFLNYLLDCLPATVLDVSSVRSLEATNGAAEAKQRPSDAPGHVRQWCVRTCLARGVRLEEYTDLTLEQIRQLAASTDPRDQQELLELYPLFSSKYEFQRAETRSIPYADFAVEFAQNSDGRVLHSFGAIQSLERLLDLLTEDGFIHFNEYGQTEVKAGAEYEHQHFSLTSAIGLNFPLVKAYFGNHLRACWAEPVEETENIHARLLGHKPPEETVRLFRELFSKAASDRLREPIERARRWLKGGRIDSAARSYREALERQPFNWVLANEVAQFLTFTLREARSGADMAKAGLALNPLSADLWNTLGDALYDWGRFAEARAAYLRAEQLNESDPRSRYNLAWVYAAEKNYPAAIQKIGEAFMLDRTGEYRDRLLHKQNEILTRVTQRNRQEMLRLANRISSGPAAVAAPNLEQRERVPANEEFDAVADEKSKTTANLLEAKATSRPDPPEPPSVSGYSMDIGPWR